MSIRTVPNCDFCPRDAEYGAIDSDANFYLLCPIHRHKAQSGQLPKTGKLGSYNVWRLDDKSTAYAEDL